MTEPKVPRQHNEELARERVRKSPLRFLSVRRFDGNEENHSGNFIPRSDMEMHIKSRQQGTLRAVQHFPGILE